MSDAEKIKSDAFVQGYICACANILSGHGSDVEVGEALRAIGFKDVDLSKIDKVDKEILRQYKFIPRKK
jgi:hypothetical protein